MRLRLIAALVVVLASATIVSSAGADVFVVVKSASTHSATLPSAQFPNFPGSVVFPPDLSMPPAHPITLDRSQLQTLWQQAGAAYGIPWPVLAAINEIESGFGRNMGPSSAGAIGWMQFMPGTWTEWGVDANGDGVADPWNPYDAVYAAARYLAASGGATDIARAIFSYNHADWYVRQVLSLAHLYGQGQGVAFTLDTLQSSLDGTREAASAAGQRAAVAQAAVHRLGVRIARLDRRARRTNLLSRQLDLQAEAAHLRERLSAAQARAGQALQALEQAQQSLQQAQQQAAAPSFATGARTVLSAPTVSGNWVFPVGGGPAKVSAAHTHHDYPAVDIDAPMGSPVYALSDAVVLRSWFQPDPRCGIGVTLRTSDGQVWTYCHLSYMDPNIVAGASLTAGESVGLVGMTGDATGPHLHLQLQPATRWPQQEAWFESFAGTAFSWQDAPTPAPNSASQPLRYIEGTAPEPTTSGSAPVFAVVPSSQPSLVFFSRS